MTIANRSHRYRSVLLCTIAIGCVAARGLAKESPGETQESPSAAAEEPRDDERYELRYKFKRGDVVRFDVTHRASIHSTIEQTTQAAQTRTDSVKVWKVIDVLPNGEIEFINSVDRVHMVNQLPDRDPVEYDSARDENPPPGFEDAARAVGTPLSVVRMTPQGKIVRRQEKLGRRPAEEDAPIVVRLPEEPVSIGDTWDEPFELQVALEEGKSKPIQTRRHHELTSVADGIAVIKVTYQVLSPINAQIESQLVQRMMEGEVRFDLEAGRVAAQQMDVDRRILGFAGPTSSMHYVMRMEEKLLPPDAKSPAKQKSPAQRLGNAAKQSPDIGASQRKAAKASNSPRNARKAPRASAKGHASSGARR